MRFNLTHILPDPWMHGLLGYSEIIETIGWGLTALGHRVTMMRNGLSPDAINIVFGFQMLRPVEIQALPPNTIAYNFEQLVNVEPENIRSSFHEAARCLQIWDYSPDNFATWHKMGPIAEPLLVPIGYAPILSRIKKCENEPIDVFLYGTPTRERLHVIEQLCDAGIRVIFACGFYGPARDAMISSAKIVLNLNRYQTSRIFEIVRVSYLLANSKAVVSDIYPDSHIEPDILNAVAFAPLEEVAAKCLALLQDDAGRKRLEESGLEIIRKRDIREILSRVLPTDTTQ